MHNTIKPGTQAASSTGGTITWTTKGLIHTAGRNFSGQTVSSDCELQPQVKVARGPGRPRKTR